jgi:hypothetical protein
MDYRSYSGESVMRPILRIGVLLLLPLPLLGCGKSYKLAPVSGQITLDGRPLAHAEVRFVPAGGQDFPYSVDETDELGHYELHLGIEPDIQGAVVGEHRVEITLNAHQNKALLMEQKSRGGRISPHAREIVPRAFNRDSKITCTVPPDGRVNASFALLSK